MRPNAFHAAALAVLLAAGCAQPTSLLVHPTAQVAGQSASLHLKLDLGRQIQDLVSDVTTVAVSIELAGREPISQTFTRTELQSDSLDFPGLPSGDATVKVRAFNDQQALMAEGATLVPLLIGRRTLAQIYLGLNSDGRTDRLPFAPIEAGTYSIDPATDSTNPTPPPGGETPPPEGTFLPRDYFAPSKMVIARTYSITDEVTDAAGPHQSTGKFSEQVMPGMAGPLVVRSEDLDFTDHQEHRDATDSFRIMTDGAVAWDTIRRGPQGVSTSSVFVPSMAMTTAGVPLYPEGKMYLDGDETLYLGDTPYYCLKVHEHRGPEINGLDTIYWVNMDIGIMRLTQVGTVLRPDNTSATVNRLKDLTSVTFADPTATAFRIRR